MSRLILCSFSPGRCRLLHKAVVPSPRPTCRGANNTSWFLQRRLTSTHRHNAPPLQSVTLLTPKPSFVTPEDVISQLSALRATADPWNHVPIVLTTPAFATWLEKENPFVQSLVSHVFKPDTLSGNDPIHSVEAVVDRLPSPTKHELRKAAIEPDPNILKEDSIEGLCVAILNKNSLSGKVLQPSARRGGKVSADGDSTLSVLIRSEHEDGRGTETELGIQIANTIFTAGRPSTMFASSWLLDEGKDALAISQRQDLSVCKIQLATRSTVRPYIPLRPLTRPRKVVASMGNVLRQLSTEDNPDVGVPASAELEKIIPEYIEEHGLQDGGLAIWAVVRSSATHKAVSQLGSNAMDDISSSLDYGARIHRVMSGGGGWGKKMGLLSLDPEYSDDDHGETSRSLLPLDDLFDQEKVNALKSDEVLEEFLSRFPTSTQSVDGMVMAPLREVVKPGDFVQFFVAPAAVGPETAPGDHEGNGLKLVFGVDPSRADMLPESYDEQLTGVDAKAIVTVPDRFGACSEKAMIYTTNEEQLFEDPTDTTSPVDVGKTFESGTKIDVPRSRITVDLPFE